LSLENVIDAIMCRQSFLITSHVDLDGDAVGSELGLALILKRIGKRPTVVNQDPFPSRYGFLPGVQFVRDLPQEAEDVDAAIVLDSTSLERAGSVGQFLSQSRVPIVNIDHHAGNVNFGAVNFVNPQACATAVIVLDVLRKLGQSIGPEVATWLYTALVSETGSFRLSNTSPEGLEVAACLTREGADPYEIAARLFSRRSPQALRLIGDALRSLDIRLGGELAVISLSKSQIDESQVAGDELEGLVNFAMSVQGARVGAFLREIPECMVKVSLRSNGTVDVDQIARHFGGGGHSNAAGARIGGRLEEVSSAVIEEIADAIGKR